MIVNDLITRSDRLAADRSNFESIWDEIAKLCLPTAEWSSERDIYKRLDGWMTPRSTQRAPQIFDSSSVVMVDRLAAGMESMTVPQSEKWHGLDVAELDGGQPTQAEEKWFEQVRDFLFDVRYDPRSGFQTAIQATLRRTVAFGTGVMLTEESFGTRERTAVQMPMLYRHVPLAQCFLAVDAQGVPDTNFRRLNMTARQLVQRFGDKVSEKVKASAEDDKRRDDSFEILHAVMPRAEGGSGKNARKDSAFASYWVEIETKHLIQDSGYFEFPYTVFYWSQGDDGPYGESPVMMAIADIRRLQAMSKVSLRAFQQWADPPLALPTDGVMNRPSLNPRALNYGAVDENGNLRVRPLITAQRPDFAEQILATKRNDIKESLYINLFQAMLETPDGTATAAMIRADEKGQLLGPAGSKIQTALSFLIEREFGILERKGAFQPGSPLAPPDTLGGKRVSTRFTSPLDRMRRAKELVGIQQTYEMAGMMAQIKQDPSILDRLDDDQALDIAREVTGAPARIIKDDKLVQRIRAERQQLAQQAMAQEAATMVSNGARAASDGANAAQDVAAAAKDNPEAAEALMAAMGQ